MQKIEEKAMSISRKYKESGSYPTRKTGHIADLISLSDEGVRMYERYGLVYPEKEDQNGYRAFDVMDTTMLLYGKVYRDCGFSLKEAGHLANHAALPEVDQAYTDLIARRKKALALEIAHIERLEELRHEIELAQTQLNQCELVTRPGLYRLEFMNKELKIEKQMQQELQTWMNRYLPFAMLSTRYYLKTLNLPPNEIRATSGLGMPEKYASLFGIQANACISYDPPCPAIHVITCADNGQLNPDLSICQKFADEHGLQFCGDMLGLGIVNLHFSETFDRYYHLWIPVRPTA